MIKINVDNIQVYMGISKIIQNANLTTFHLN